MEEKLFVPVVLMPDAFLGTSVLFREGVLDRPPPGSDWLHR
jgi:hypothetical protein